MCRKYMSKETLAFKYMTRAQINLHMDTFFYIYSHDNQIIEWKFLFWFFFLFILFSFSLSFHSFYDDSDMLFAVLEFFSLHTIRITEFLQLNWFSMKTTWFCCKHHFRSGRIIFVLNKLNVMISLGSCDMCMYVCGC